MSTKTKRIILDEIDKKILKILQQDCRIPLGEIAEKLDVSKSTVHYRIKRLERKKIIEKYTAKVNLFNLGDDFQAVILIRAMYGPEYREKISNVLSESHNIWAAYDVFGEWDFAVLMRADNRETFVKELDSRLEGTNLIQRTNTIVISRIIKETEKYVID